MNVLDENIPESQRLLLKSWRIRVKQIGNDIGRKGMKDEEQLLPLLHSLRQPVLFTRDYGFYDARYVHGRYGLVCLVVAPQEAASFIRRFLRHGFFNTKAKRMGMVVRVSEGGLKFWQLGATDEQGTVWR